MASSSQSSSIRSLPDRLLHSKQTVWGCQPGICAVKCRLSYPARTLKSREETIKDGDRWGRNKDTQEDENANLELSCVRAVFPCSLSRGALKCTAVIKHFEGKEGWPAARLP